MSKKKPELPEDAPFNPLYAGVGGWPRLLSDEAWIRLAVGKINDTGARPFLRRLLAELREALTEDEEDEGLTGDEMLSRLRAHIDKKEVTQCLRLGTAPGALLIFDDGHAMPVVPPEDEADALEQIVGKSLVMAEVVDDNPDAEPYLNLFFHPDPEDIEGVVARAPDDEEAVRQALDAYLRDNRELVRVETVWESSTAIICPEQHRAELPDDEGFDLLEAADRLDNHLRGLRVADRVRIPGGGPEALVFDDGHVLPILPAEGAAPTPDLESVIGKFLVWVDIEDDDRSAGPRLALVFSDDESAADRIDQAAEDLSDDEFEKLVEALRSDETALVIWASADGASGLFCPAEHDEGPVNDDGPGKNGR